MPKSVRRGDWLGGAVLVVVLLFLLLIYLLLNAWQQQWLLYRDAPFRALPVPVQPKFDEIATAVEMKTTFLSYIGVLVTNENRRLLKMRRSLATLREKQQRNRAFTLLEYHFIEQILAEYKLERNGMNSEHQYIPESIFNELDVVIAPVPIVLAQAQAVIESGWGRSRFALQANNFYGQRCFDLGCGLVPENRPAEQSYEVKSFGEAAASVASYIKNLNSNAAYAGFRQARAELMLLKSPLNPNFSEAEVHQLVEHLQAYSTRRQAYIQQVQSMVSAILAQ